MAFNPVQPQAAQRAYVQGNVIRQPQNTVNAGFAQFGGGIAGLAESVGRIGEVFDNWGAGKRAEQREKDKAFFERAQYIHDDQIDSILSNPEQLEALARSEGYDAETFAAKLEMAKATRTPEKMKMDAASRFDHKVNPGIMAETGEGVIEDPQVVDEPEAVDGPVEEGLEQPAPGDPTSDGMISPFEEYNALLETREYEPNTDKDMEEEYAALENPQTKVPNPTRLQEAQKRGSKAVMDHMLNREMFANTMYYYAAHGQQLDPTTANDIAHRMAMSDDALREGMVAYALEHMSHIPPSQAEYFNNPEYFQAAVDFQRYQSDPKFRSQVDSKEGEYESIVNKVSKLSFLWKKVMGEAVVGTATKASENNMQYIDRDLKERAQAETERVNLNTHTRDMMRIGMDQQKINMLRQELQQKLRLTDGEFEMKWKEHGLKVRDQHRRWRHEDVDKALEITQQKAKMHAEIFTNQSKMYSTISSIGNLKDQTTGGKMLIDLWKAELELAAAAAEASSKHHPGGNLAAGVEGQTGTKFNAKEIKDLQAMTGRMRQQIMDEYKANGISLFLPTGERMEVDVTQDMSTIRDMMFQRMGYDQNYIATEGRYLDKLRDGFFVSEGAGYASTPPKLSGYYDYAIRNDLPIQDFSGNFPAFKQWMKKNGFEMRDMEQLHKQHQLQVERQRRRQENAAIYGS